MLCSSAVFVGLGGKLNIQEDYCVTVKGTSKKVKFSLPVP
jgi:hypothetical protein